MRFSSCDSAVKSGNLGAQRRSGKCRRAHEVRWPLKPTTENAPASLVGSHHLHSPTFYRLHTGRAPVVHAPLELWNLRRWETVRVARARSRPACGGRAALTRDGPALRQGGSNAARSFRGALLSSTRRESIANRHGLLTKLTHRRRCGLTLQLTSCWYDLQLVVRSLPRI